MNSWICDCASCGFISPVDSHPDFAHLHEVVRILRVSVRVRHLRSERLSRSVLGAHSLLLEVSPRVLQIENQSIISYIDYCAANKGLSFMLSLREICLSSSIAVHSLVNCKRHPTPKYQVIIFSSSEVMIIVKVEEVVLSWHRESKIFEEVGGGKLRLP